MQIQFKLLSQEQFVVDAEPSTTIGDLKQKIEQLKGENFKAESLKLIYAGKMWDKNANTVESENYKEGTAVVVMAAKPKAAPKTEPVKTTDTASAAAPTSQPPAPASGAAPQAQPSPAAPVAQSAAAAAPVGVFGLSPQEIEAMTENISQMGYPKTEVQRALRASFFNPERAVEYLISGLPAGAENASLPPGLAQGQGVQPASAQQPAAAAPVPAGADSLAFFRDSPQFAQMRQMIQQDPALLQQFMADIGQSNPELLQRIVTNQEDFLQMLNAENESDEGEMDDFGGGGMDDLGAAPPGVHYLNVNAEENAAIERLKAMGFDERAVIQAFFACDKNEELTANFLLQNMEDMNEG